MNEFFNSGRAEWVTEKALQPVCQIMEVLHKPRDAQAQTERLRQTNTQKQKINKESDFLYKLWCCARGGYYKSDNLVLSTELLVLIGHRKTFKADAV